MIIIIIIIMMEFGIENASNEKQEMTHDRRNQTTKKKLREKETYENLEILETDSIKQEEMKEKFKKSTSGERESCLKQNYIAGIL